MFKLKKKCKKRFKISEKNIFVNQGYARNHMNPVILKSLEYGRT